MTISFPSHILNGKFFSGLMFVDWVVRVLHLWGVVSGNFLSQGKKLYRPIKVISVSSVFLLPFTFFGFPLLYLSNQLLLVLELFFVVVLGALHHLKFFLDLYGHSSKVHHLRMEVRHLWCQEIHAAISKFQDPRLS